MPPHSLTNFEKKKKKIKANLNLKVLIQEIIYLGAYIINLDEYKSIRTHWTALHVNGDNVTYFDTFGVEYILNEN